ncbi:MAG: UDP-3-O-(3-hydroxymyristoyl)glucosamine N-acyltransferase [Candidatus Cloacimonetes bacterium]|nr:UDP-3-O-(3-hydroxymyristoyl)glucosamine N-acyltransferase [Candidatus Cloacimonadota bacterium]
MKEFKLKLGYPQIQGITRGTLINQGAGQLYKVSEPREADEHTIIFLEQDKLLEQVQGSAAGLIITTEAYRQALGNRPLLIVDNPYFSLMVLIHYWLMQEDANRLYQIHPSAIIAADVRYEGEVFIGAHVVIESGCVLGNKAVIEAGCHLGANVVIGSGTKLMPGVNIYSDCSLGKNCLIHSGAVIGADGFGFMLMGEKQQKIPQVGNVSIGDDVEIGANSCVDRATLGSTIIGTGTKIDNFVQIGHNCIIGKHCILCAHVGLAGSTVTGDYVYLAGQVGAAGHLKIGHRAMIGAQSGITGDIPDDARYLGSPALEGGLQKRIMAIQKNLPDMFKAYLKAKKADKE